MKRECNEKEKEILFQNRHMFYKGILQAKVQGSGWAICISIGIAIAGVIAILLFVFLSEVITNTRWVTRISVFGGIGIAPIIYLWYSKYAIKKGQKKFFKKKSVMINGAQIIKIDKQQNQFYYVEDDVCDENGKPILFSYPADAEELKTVKEGARALIVYNGEKGYHLSRTNPALLNLLLSRKASTVYPEDIEGIDPIPHRNALKCEREEHEITAEESETYLSAYAKEIGNMYWGLFLMIGGMVIAAIILCSVLFGNLEHKLSTFLLWGIGISAGLIVLGVVAYFAVLLTVNCTTFKSIKEVMVYYVNQGTEMKETGVVVFEWNTKGYEKQEYKAPYISSKLSYGTILYKLKTEKGKYVFLEKEKLMK